jgi:hypothetical protein
MLYCSILLHCIDLTLCFAFMPSICDVGYYSLGFLYCHYMFRHNRPSSCVQVVVMKESAGHCNAILLLLCNYLGLLLVMWNPVFKHPVALLYLKLFMYYTVRQQCNKLLLLSYTFTFDTTCFRPKCPSSGVLPYRIANSSHIKGMTHAKTGPHTARGNNAQARGTRNTTTVLRTEKQVAAIKHLKKRIQT